MSYVIQFEDAFLSFGPEGYHVGKEPTVFNTETAAKAALGTLVLQRGPGWFTPATLAPHTPPEVLVILNVGAHHVRLLRKGTVWVVSTDGHEATYIQLYDALDALRERVADALREAGI